MAEQLRCCAVCIRESGEGGSLTADKMGKEPRRTQLNLFFGIYIFGKLRVTWAHACDKGIK